VDFLIKANILGLEISPANTVSTSRSLIVSYGQQRWKLTGDLEFNIYHSYPSFNSDEIKQSSVLGGRVIDIFDKGVVIVNGDLTIECSGIDSLQQLLNISDDRQWLNWINQLWNN
jgi:hypothetical protein